jgi:hypothetical protein
MGQRDFTLGGDELVTGSGGSTKGIERTTLSIPGTSRSFNQVGLRSHWTVGRAEKLKWEGFIGIALMEARVPRQLKRVSATATLRFKQKRRRDSGNWRPILEKALGDILVSAGYLEDDTADLYSFGRVELVAPVDRPETILVLDYLR